jgi:hypothetical protein
MTHWAFCEPRKSALSGDGVRVKHGLPYHATLSDCGWWKFSFADAWALVHRQQVLVTLAVWWLPPEAACVITIYVRRWWFWPQCVVYPA